MSISDCINVKRFLSLGLFGTIVRHVFYFGLLNTIPEAYGWTTYYYNYDNQYHSRWDTCRSSSRIVNNSKNGGLNKNKKSERFMTSIEREEKKNLLEEPDENESNFGRMGYWNKFYSDTNEFSWYSPWSDISPFFMELVPLPLDNHQNNNNSLRTAPPRVLLPGIGNDQSMVDMYDAGYKRMTAFDYAPEGVECAKRFFGKERLIHNSNNKGDDDSTKNLSSLQEGVNLQVADARDLPFEDDSFDAVLEKGTLDAVYLSGAADKETSMKHLSMAVSELARVTVKGGIVMSITAACADSVEYAFANNHQWQIIRDGGFFMTEDGYSSNNVDATIFAWKRL